VTNWTTITKKVFYSCNHCGAIWLYSKGLNCPVLIDVRNILPEGGTPRPDDRRRSSRPRSMKSSNRSVRNGYRKG